MIWRSVRGFAGVGGSLLAQQGLNAVAGILIVRSLTRGDYAIYSVALTSVGGITVLAEAGVIASILSIGGQVDASQRLRLYRFARKFRWVALALAVSLFAPAAVLLLMGAGSTWPEWIGVLGLVVLGASAASTSAMYGAIFRLEGRFAPVNIVMAFSAAARLLAVVFLVSLPSITVSPGVFLAVTGVFSVAESIFLSRRLRKAVLKSAENAWPAAFRRNAIRQIPSSVYYVAQSIVLPLVLVAVGKPLIIADIAALSRYAIIFSVASLAVSQFLAPRLATSPHSRVAKTYIVGTAGFSGAAVLLIGAVGVTKSALLALIGNQYSALGLELVIVSIGAAVGGLASLLVALNQARAWLRFSWLQIPMSCAWIVGLLVFSDLSSTLSAALFFALTPLPAVCVLVICGIIGWRDELRTNTGGNSQ